MQAQGIACGGGCKGKIQRGFRTEFNGVQLDLELAVTKVGDLMTQLSIDERVAALEVQVANLVKSSTAYTPAATTQQVSDWRATFGMFAGDPIMQEVIEEGHRIRQEDREQASE